MTLRVFTARIGTPGLTDALDVTRKSAKGDGLAFAPSWAILRPALDGMRRAQGVIICAGAAHEEHSGRVDLARVWWSYVAAYSAEMRESYRRDRGPWDRLLARERVVLLCYCADPDYCHRTLLGAMILPRMGATYEGEVAS